MQKHVFFLIRIDYRQGGWGLKGSKHDIQMVPKYLHKLRDLSTYAILSDDWKISGQVWFEPIQSCHQNIFPLLRNFYAWQGLRKNGCYGCIGTRIFWAMGARHPSWNVPGTTTEIKDGAPKYFSQLWQGHKVHDA